MLLTHDDFTTLISTVAKKSLRRRAVQSAERKRQRAVLRLAVERDHDLRGVRPVVGNDFATARRRRRLAGNRHSSRHRANDRARGRIRKKVSTRREWDDDSLHGIAG